MGATPTRYMGGQAVMDGVMMRGEQVWAVAVRREDGGIEIRVDDAPHWAERYGRIPLVRGVVNLVESLSLGMRALTWSADVNAAEDEKVSGGATAVSLGMALVFFVGVFLVLPMLGARGASALLGLSGAAHILNYYHDAVEANGHAGAPEHAIAHGWKPALLCELTTALGLITLVTSEPMYTYIAVPGTMPITDPAT